MIVCLPSTRTYSKQSPIPAVVKQPPHPADTKKRIIYSCEIINTEEPQCHQQVQGKALHKSTQVEI